MKTLIEIFKTVGEIIRNIILATMVVGGVVFILTGGSMLCVSPKEEYSKLQPQKPITTTRKQFDSLGIKIVFSCDTSYRVRGTNIKPCYWIPKKFKRYDNGDYVWYGNRMDVFLAYPQCTFLLVGMQKNNDFLTDRVSICR